MLDYVCVCVGGGGHCWAAGPLGLGLSLYIYVPLLYAIHQDFTVQYQRGSLTVVLQITWHRTILRHAMSATRPTTTSVSMFVRHRMHTATLLCSHPSQISSHKCRLSLGRQRDTPPNEDPSMMILGEDTDRANIGPMA
jgi:hypothetical protein